LDETSSLLRRLPPWQYESSRRGAAVPMPFVAAGLPCAWRQPMRNAAQPASLGQLRIGHLSANREQLDEIRSVVAGARRVAGLVRRICPAPAAAFIAA